MSVSDKNIVVFQNKDIWIAGLQLFLSILLLVLFASSLQQDDIIHTLSQCSISWLIFALLLKSLSLLLREVRLWLALPLPRPRFVPTMNIGLFTGALHTFLPLRGGDLLSIGLLNKNLNIPIPKASFAVGLCAFLEMLVFGVIAVLTLISTQHLWFEVHALYQEILSWMSVATGIGIFIFILAILTAKFASPPEDEQPSLVQSIIPEMVRLLQSSVVSRNYMFSNIALTVADVLVMLLSFSCIFYCLNISCPLPFTVSTLILGVSAVAAFALPPSYGAGPAASAILIFSLFQLPEENALAYAAIWWVLSQVPSLLFGIPAMWFMKSVDNSNTNTKVDSPPFSS